MGEDEQHQAAFGEHTGLSDRSRFIIDDIKSNSGYFYILMLHELIGTVELSDLAWKLLGRYIANNTHLVELGLSSCGLSNEKMALLCSELVGNESVCSLNLEMNEFGIEGLRSIVPLLRNSPQLKNIHFSRNNFDTECFELLVQTLHGLSNVELLYLVNCNIIDISALESYPFTIQKLALTRNNIGRDGCITLCNLLQQESGSTLTHLYLSRTGMGDEEAELLATSLKQNKKLDLLFMADNNITERGRGAFLKLLLDASSIENTYNSNHTLTCLTFDVRARATRDETSKQIKSALHINLSNQNSAASRAKVIKYQLNSKRRKEICQLQGIDYSAGSNFVDIEPLLLPHILALIGRELGHSEFYTSLIPMVPALMSYINRRALIDDVIAKNSRDIADLEAEYARRKFALTKKRDELHNRRACMESKADAQGKDESEQKLTSCVGKKRRI